MCLEKIGTVSEFQLMSKFQCCITFFTPYRIEKLRSQANQANPFCTLYPTLAIRGLIYSVEHSPQASSICMTYVQYDRTLIHTACVVVLEVLHRPATITQLFRLDISTDLARSS